METKSLIIDIATKLFQQKGYTGVGLNEILKEANVTKGALYHHFPNGKEELLIACIHSLHDEITKDIERHFSRYPTTLEAATATLDRLIDIYQTEGTISGYTISSVVSGMDSLSDRVREACNQLYDRMQAIYREKLIGEGYSPQSAASIALMVTASIEGGIMLCLTTRSIEPIKVIEQTLPFILKGLSSRE